MKGRPDGPGRTSASCPMALGGRIVGFLAAAVVGAAATPPQPGPSLRVSPAEVVQGGVVLVEVVVPGAEQVRASAAGRGLTLYRTASGYRGFVGTSPATPPGVLVVDVRAAVAGSPVHLSRSVRVRPGRFGVRSLRVPPRLLDPQLAAYERRRVQEATSAPLPRPLWTGRFLSPVDGPVVSPYGVRSVYNGRFRGHHLGVDLRAAAGSPVRAAQRGVVVLAEQLPLGGNTVMVDHGAAVFSSYLHLARLHVRAGQTVHAGTVVGTVGSTGLSTAPHLHWAVHVNGVPVDPLAWARQAPPVP